MTTRLLFISLVIVFCNQGWANGNCAYMFPKQKPVLQSLLPQSKHSLYHETLLEFIYTYNKAFSNKPSQEIFVNFDNRIFEERDLNRQMRYIVEKWNTEGDPRATFIRTELLDLLPKDKLKFNLKLLKNLSHHLYSLLNSIAPTHSEEYLKLMTMVDFEYKKQLH